MIHPKLTRAALLPALFVSATALAETESPAPAVPPSAWNLTAYGFLELDAVMDTTQAYNDLGGWVSTAIPKEYTYAGSRGRTQFTARNSRIGLRLAMPERAGVRAAATLEADFVGNQPSDASESAFLTNGALRMRLANVLVATDYVDVLLGQTWSLFSFNPFFLPASTLLLPMPGEAFKRDIQLRLSHRWKTAPLDIELGVSANRPPQRDAQVPDLQAGLLLALNGWTGVHTPGALGTSLDPLSVAVSGAGRRFRVSDFEGTPAGTSPDPRFSNSATGYGIVADAMIPVIPATSAQERGHALTLIGQFTTGTGYADLLNGLVANGGGPTTPSAGYPMVPGSPDKYVPNIQPGLVTYDASGKLHTIDWRTFLAGLQYYLPPSGKVFVSVNYAEARSDNVARWADPGQLPFIFTKTRYVDGAVFWDAMSMLRVAASYQFLMQTFADGETAHNGRAELSAYVSF